MPNKKDISFKKEKCSPKQQEDKLPFSCYTADALKKIKDVWNVRHKDEQIKTNSPRKIWKELQKHMADTCDSESCWIRHQCIKHDVDKSLLGGMFAPISPEKWNKNPQEWLTTVDIQKVMSQWEKADSKFIFMGPSPIDYDTHRMFNECVWEDICKFDLTNIIKRGKTKVGLIFNLDKHNQSGSHWVAIYIDINRGHIYFFDSYGSNIPTRLHKFCKEVKKQSKNTYKIIINKKTHQRSNTECGMYSMYFIIQLVNGTRFDTFQTERVPDEKMIQLRKEYFNSYR
tara:strand:- start:5339 stop:6193 length:855 start_codon:yes stop_codon:yes gene_type:complete